MKLRLPANMTLPSISAPALWGKLPSHGDFVRHNLRFHWDDAIKTWIRDTFRPLAQHAHTTPAQMQHAGMPWSFILPPGYLSFTSEEFVIGVWITSSDKLGRQYPLIMLQTVPARWLHNYLSHHASCPREWLFAAARIIARAVYTDATAAPDPVRALCDNLHQVWQHFQPTWKSLITGQDTIDVQRDLATLLPKAHPDDFARQLDGVRFMPRTDWPGSALNEHTPLFWQQDLQGRFVSVAHAPHHTDITRGTP